MDWFAEAKRDADQKKMDDETKRTKMYEKNKSDATRS